MKSVFFQEAKMPVDATKALPFVELNSVLQSLAARDVQPALKWAEVHREELEARHSGLEYKLHKMQFIQLVRRSPPDQQAILRYALNFQNFRSTEWKKGSVHRKFQQKKICKKNLRALV